VIQLVSVIFFFFQAEDGIRDRNVTGVQTCALPISLQIAIAAAEAVSFIGMPEGRIPLAQAVAHIASAPKSNAAYKAIDAAFADVRAGKLGTIPTHLRDAHYAGAKDLGHGVGYEYAHDGPTAAGR